VATNNIRRPYLILADRSAAQQLNFLPNLRVLVIPAQEEWEIARQCFELQTAVPTSAP